MVRILSCAAVFVVAMSAIATFVGAGDQKPLEEPKVSSGQATTADKKNSANPFEGRIMVARHNQPMYTKRRIGRLDF